MEEKKIANVRTPELIGAEIRMYVMTGRQITLLCGIEIGRRITEVKELLPHGEWLPWLERETDFSERTAQRYMRVFTEYGANQMWLLEPETNATTLSDLPISKALALLSVPESEREAFAESVGAAEISTRELEQAIAGRQAAEAQLESERKKAEEAAAELQEARERVKELESRPIEVAVERDEKAIEEAAAAARAEAQKKLDALQKQLETAQKKAEKAEKERDTLKDAAAKAGAEAEEKAKEAVSEAQGKLAAAERETAAAREELERTRKQLAASDKDVTEFGVHFKALQNEVRELAACIEKVQARDGAIAEKMRGALRQVLAPWAEGGAK